MNKHYVFTVSTVGLLFLILIFGLMVPSINSSLKVKDKYAAFERIIEQCARNHSIPTERIACVEFEKSRRR